MGAWVYDDPGRSQELRARTERHETDRQNITMKTCPVCSLGLQDSVPKCLDCGHLFPNVPPPPIPPQPPPPKAKVPTMQFGTLCPVCRSYAGTSQELGDRLWQVTLVLIFGVLGFLCCLGWIVALIYFVQIFIYRPVYTCTVCGFRWRV